LKKASNKEKPQSPGADKFQIKNPKGNWTKFKGKALAEGQGSFNLASVYRLPFPYLPLEGSSFASSSLLDFYDFSSFGAYPGASL
jgi:hypothetical protein